MDAPTIYALASGSGVAGVAVIRVSGARCAEVCSALTGRDVPAARRLLRVDILDGDQQGVVDSAMLVSMPGPNSLTGEDILELHIHGGRATTSAVLELLSKQPGLRLAEPGEFSRRAFENGKFDLTAAEGLNDLILAETEEQRRQALWQMGGGLAELYEGWRSSLMKSMALFEANIDFSDEELPEGLYEEAKKIVADVARDIERHVSGDQTGSVIREGFRIALVGPPNAGKSSLLNRLAKEDVAIVSDRPGTTRDVITVRMMLGGYLVELQDTAGLREAADEIEAEGIRRTNLTRERAQLRLLVVPSDARNIDEFVRKAGIGESDFIAVNKIDLLTGGKEGLASADRDLPRRFLTSAKSGEGIADLLVALEKEVQERLTNVQQVAVTRRRHQEALEECVECLRQFLAFEGKDVGFEAEELRLAVQALGRVTGRTGVEDMLDIVFSDFCIGK